MNKYFYNPEYKGEKSYPERDLGSGVTSSVLFGSKNFFEMLMKQCNVKEDEEIIGVEISDTAINVRLKIK